MASLTLSLDNPADYQTFLAVRRLPRYRITGRECWFPDEYADRVGLKAKKARKSKYTPSPFLFDYQRDISRMAIEKNKFAVWADCGLGKTLIMLEFAQHAESDTGKPALIVSPLNVIDQTSKECQRWYGFEPHRIRAKDFRQWLAEGQGVGIVNYDALEMDLDGSRLGAVILDESSYLKGSYGKWGQACIQLGRGVKYKLCCTGTPAPNDRIEYGNHAVFLDRARTLNEFLAKYFVNRGQTENRWELKPHALRPFYRSLSHWGIFLSDPSVYGWKDNCESIPPIHVHIHHVPLTSQQRDAAQDATGSLMVTEIGGITSRGKLARLAKGNHNGQQIATNKDAFIRDELIGTWPDESTIVWCLYNDEQERMGNLFPDAANVSGDTKYEDRIRLIGEFQDRTRNVLISKPKILGFGLNLQVATRQVFSALQDSYEQFYQAVKRSNRYGSTKDLNVHIPVTELEEPMIETVLRKAKRVEEDTREQERMFRDAQG